MKNPLSWFSAIFSSRPRHAAVSHDFYEQLLHKLREDIEIRIQAAIAEAHAFAEQQADAELIGRNPVAERGERRAELAAIEAKAYADEAVGAVASSVAATAKMALHLSRRMDAIEQAVHDADKRPADSKSNV